MYNKGAKAGPGKVVAPNKLWHAFKHKNLDVFKRELTCSLEVTRWQVARGRKGKGGIGESRPLHTAFSHGHLQNVPPLHQLPADTHCAQVVGVVYFALLPWKRASNWQNTVRTDFTASSTVILIFIYVSYYYPHTAHT